jgi:hypothetical protein
VHSNLALRQGELYSSLIHIFVQVHAQVPAAAAAASGRIKVLKMYLVVYSLEQQHADFMCVCV